MEAQGDQGTPKKSDVRTGCACGPRPCRTAKVWREPRSILTSSASWFETSVAVSDDNFHGAGTLRSWHSPRAGISLPGGHTRSTTSRLLPETRTISLTGVITNTQILANRPWLLLWSREDMAMALLACCFPCGGWASSFTTSCLVPHVLGCVFRCAERAHPLSVTRVLLGQV